ncbi:MAG: glycerate kinase [Planctomycetota bacterium]|nr:MAG: glycerate kinase [Planctomycetota bacterium]
MLRTAMQLRRDALRIWTAGLAAVRSPRLIHQAVQVEQNLLALGDWQFDLDRVRRIAVVGGGKAAAGMAVALEQALGPRLLREKRLQGIVNVPADCLLPTDAIRLHPARPPGVNEPTLAAAAGAEEMLRLVAELDAPDLCLCLLSGGGSALLPAPIDGVSLADKIELTQALSAAGATIAELNAVRRELSRFKGGGLARACRAGSLVSLVLSDVLGDDLSLVASGPTVLRKPTPAAAADVLRSLELTPSPAIQRALAVLDRLAKSATFDLPAMNPHVAAAPRNAHGCRINNYLLANNATAVDAAGLEALRLGYSHAMVSATAPEGPAEEVACRLAAIALRMRREDGPDCLISGGEPTVRLAPPVVRGRGGRNQQLCLAALAQASDWPGLALVSGGTDGEDGPTDAAGACVDEHVVAAACRLRLDPADYLARNDAYSFFEQTGGLLMTGPTHTNVCDLRVITVSR